MSVYTIHEPPQRAAGGLPEAERFTFVRDGFSFWAFLLAPLWMLWHRMWLVFAGYAVVCAALDAVMVEIGASDFVMAVVGLFVSLLVGLEASTLRRYTLRRRGWRNAGIVSGDDLEDAERRFFDTWLREMPARHAPSLNPAAQAVAAMPPSGGDVIGLFPEPGARR